MDTTKTYIKMCDCPEIQEHRKYDGGDWICDPENIDGRHPWAIWQKAKGKSDKEIRKFMDGLLWLPRQDQIQEMMGKTESAFCIYQAESKWGGETYQDREQVFIIERNSPEQLWLAFYMREKHSLFWSGDKWRK